MRRSSGAARFAAPVLGLELGGASAVASDDPFAARHALYWLTANLSAERPLALLVDDAHWADGASLGVLAHIAHRLEGIPVALVVASRTEESQDTLEALRRHAAVYGTLLHLAPLSEDGAAAVIRTLAPAADDAQCRACYAATGGNPFLLRELARSAAGGDGGIDPERVAEQSPERVTQEIEARLSRLPEPAVRLARATAILGGGVPLRPAAALAEVDPHDAAEAVDALVAAGVLRRALPHELLHPLEFVHPLVRAAVYAGLGAARPVAQPRARGAAARPRGGLARARRGAAAALPARRRPVGVRAARRRRPAGVGARGRGRRDAVPAPRARRAAAAAGPPRGPARPRRRRVPQLRARCGDRPPARGDGRRARLGPALPRDDAARRPARADRAREPTRSTCSRSTSRRSPTGRTCASTAEAALVNVTRIDPATRPRAARVIERLRRRVDAGEERDRAVLGTIAAEMGMAGEPAGPMAETSPSAPSTASTSRSARRPAGRATTRCARSWWPSATTRRCRPSSARSRWPASAARCSTSARR